MARTKRTAGSGPHSPRKKLQTSAARIDRTNTMSKKNKKNKKKQTQDNNNQNSDSPPPYLDDDNAIERRGRPKSTKSKSLSFSNKS